ncbi:MAG: amidase family protein, partial [Bdellovibrio sp.]
MRWESARWVGKKKNEVFVSLHNLSLEELRLKIKKREVSTKEVCRHFLDRVENLNPQLNAWLELNPHLLSEADRLDQAAARGDDLGSMQGIPVGLKDMFCTAGLETTAGSKILKGFRPSYDATVVTKLKKAGALVLGKLNQDEFAMGSSNENSAYGPVRNPWNSTAVPGGSSGGSAAAVAAGLTPLALGTDTGGSIRQPAHFCNLVGIKPTYGRISRYGIIAYASSLDQAGPMVRRVEDAALALEVLSGFDPMDSTSSRQRVPSFRKNLNAELKGLRVGLPEEFSKTEGLDPEVAKAFQAAQEVLQKAGAQLVSVRLPLTRYAVPVYYLVATSEASSNLARYDGLKYGHRAHFESLANV